MNKLMVVLITAFAVQSYAAVPKKSYGQCTELYPKGAFIGDEKGAVVDLADAAKNGPCVNGDKSFIPAIDRKTGVTSMQETTADKAEASIVKFRSDLYAFRTHHVNEPAARKSVIQATTDARVWMGWAEAKKQPAGYEVFGSPVQGKVTARYGEPMVPNRLQPAPLYPNAPRNPPEFVGQVVAAPIVGGGRVVGALGHSIDRGGRDIMNNSSYNLDHLPNDPRALIVAPASVVGVIFGGLSQGFGRIVGGIGDAVGYAPYDAARAERKAARSQRMTQAEVIAQRDAWMHNRERRYN